MNETITWHATDVSMPDTDEVVLMCMAPPEPEPVWLGWWDSEHGTWRHADAMPVSSAVTHWASMPAGPMECA